MFQVNSIEIELKRAISAGERIRIHYLRKVGKPRTIQEGAAHTSPVGIVSVNHRAKIIR